MTTVLLAVVFTFFQFLEYSVSSFTISDGAFGSCFFFATGFHGLSSSPNKILYNIQKINNKSYSNLVSNTDISQKLNITLPTFTSSPRDPLPLLEPAELAEEEGGQVNSYYLDRRFLE